jgi:hypothetical protein
VLDDGERADDLLAGDDLLVPEPGAAEEGLAGLLAAPEAATEPDGGGS